MAFLKSVTSQPVGWIAHKSLGKSAHGPERWFCKEILGWGAGVTGGGGKDHIETGKNGAVSATAWSFGPEDLVKTKFIIIVSKKSMGRAFKIF
jgi:hypothetical protein